MSASAQAVKVVVVGSNGVGKTSLCCAYADGRVPSELPDVSLPKTLSKRVEGKDLSVALYDTNGTRTKDVNRVRPLQYENANVFLVCYSLASPASLQSVRKWVSEVAAHCPGVPVVLVGCQSDRRTKLENGEKEEAQKEEEEDEEEEEEKAAEEVRADKVGAVSKEEGEAMAREVKACALVECSAVEKAGLNDVFGEAYRAIFHGNKSASSSKSSGERRCLFM
ncbi:Rho GTPase protein rac1 [Balamuthia mandrillaris]